jgi:hypothetical protein
MSSMGTSKSADVVSGWIATALVYSGRRNPSWQLEEESVLRLQKIWQELNPYVGELSRPALGYGGCTLTAPGGDQWLVYGEVVTRTHGELIEARADTDRRFEKKLLSSAPAGSLPPWLPGKEPGS